MGPTEIHVMTAELIADRRTVRFSCPICHRCIEDGPEGITFIHRGDTSVRHQGGSMSTIDSAVEQDTPDRPVMH
ncbi:MAG: hypothetical protein IPG93_15135 [Burkholderiales bacterium]|nr:hypothetical protein [Burkholderiales bacterium]